MKKILIINFTLSFIAVIVAVVAMFLSVSFSQGELSATEIYNQSIHNVVEVKAQSEDFGESFGTGEIISHDGRIVTNAHVVTYLLLGVVKEFDECYIRFTFEKEYRAVKIEKYDRDLDLAMLSTIDDVEFELKPIRVGDSESIKAGDKIYAVGNAANCGIGIFEGIVSLSLVHIEYDNIIRNVMQCDLTIAAGNSGGALLDANGTLIGITTFRIKDTQGNVIYGIVYCIPINNMLEFIQKV